MDNRRVREAARSRHTLALLEAAGIDPAEVGRYYNRAMPAPVAPTTIPTDQAGLEELIGDSSKMQAVFGNPASLKELITNYSRAVVNRDTGISQQISEQVQQFMAQWAKDQKENGPRNGPGRLNLSDVPTPVDRALDKAGLFNKAAMGSQIDAEFKNSAEYFQAIWHLNNHQRSPEDESRMRRVRNAFSSTVPSEGGYLIPETLRSELLRVSLETSIVRPRARVIPMESLRVPFPAIDSTTNATSVYGGIVGYWTEEGAALTSSQAAFSRIVLDAKKLTAYTEVPNELLADSGQSFMAFMDQIFPEALGFYEDDAFMNGTGVGMPLGGLAAQNTAMISVTKEVGQPASSIVWDNIVKMFARMLPSSLSRAVWVASIDTFPELATMALSVGTGGSAIWLNNGQVGPPMSILGRPVIFTEKSPKLGSAGDISFIDWGFYLIGDRQVMSAMSSPHFKFNQDTTAYRIIERVDGRPWLQSAITPKNTGATLSPFVRIEAR